MTLGQQIKQARENKNLSQEELAEKLGVSRQAVSKWENDTAIPQGINRETLSQILNLDLILYSEEDSINHNSNKKRDWFCWIGWGTSFLLLALLLLAVYALRLEKNQAEDNLTEDNPVADESEFDTQTNIFESPQLTRITFYDENQNEVKSEALWYDAAKMDSILVQWTGGTPDTIKMFATPSGSETAELTELLLTKAIPDGDTTALLSADALKVEGQNHVRFELDFGETIVVSEDYNIFDFEELE